MAGWSGPGTWGLLWLLWTLVQVHWCDPDAPNLLSCRDICPILKEPSALSAVIDLFEEHARRSHQHIDLIAGTGSGLSSAPAWSPAGLVYLLHTLSHQHGL